LWSPAVICFPKPVSAPEMATSNRGSRLYFRPVAMKLAPSPANGESFYRNCPRHLFCSSRYIAADHRRSGIAEA
jgi:hypothetical protein